ncbi:MAG: zinc ABC transporter substrate-binding protein [Bacilli bacterium]|nr:zinc ABC transporter substrate-binding protein [Bacilli bacterium]
MKRIKLLLIPIFTLLLFTGCDFFKVDNMENISIITTSYPLAFIIKTLYGEHSLVKSIYPDGTNTYDYELNEKSLKNYSNEDLFIYVSYGRDKDIAVNLLNKNNSLLIIDGSLGMMPDYIDELWLNPSNLLMVSLNIKNGLTEYINNNYLIKEIDKNYEDLKLKLSMLDAEMKLTAENATSKTIVTATKSLNFLKKYGFNVISLDDDNTALEKTIQEVTEMINLSSIKYIYTLENIEDNETVKLLLENNKNLTEIKLKRLDSITTEERNNGSDYFTIMQKNIEELKKETYK